MMRYWQILVFATWFVWLGMPQSPATAQHEVMRALAQRVAPDGIGVPERIAHYIRCFRDATFQDTRLYAFQVNARTVDNGTIALTGYIEFPEIREALLAYLGHLGFDSIRDNTLKLPSPQLGERNYGFIKSTHSLVLTQPSDSAETATDALLGEPLFLLRESGGGFLLCHTAEGYLGHVRSRDVLRVGASQFQRFQTGKQVRIQKSAEGNDGVSLPVGARLKWVSQTDASVVLQLPDERLIEAPVESVAVIDDLPHPRIEHALETASRFLGTKYRWGGKTHSGIDCSGLVQTSFAASGIHLPRDSNQQVVPGRLTATRWYRNGLRRGDTLYFLGKPGRITHTGIYLGNGQYIEAVTPSVRISSLRQGDDNYSRRGDASFAFAKRLME